MNLATLVAALGAALLDFLWQGLLVGAAAALALAALRDARPQARYAVACAALALCLALPLATFVRALAPDAAQRTTTTAATATVVTVTGAVSVAQDVPTSVPPATPRSAGWPRLQVLHGALQPRLPLLVTIWSIGATLLAARMALGLAWVAGAGGVRGRPHVYWQAQLDALAERMALPRRVLLRIVDDLETPAAARVWRPVVLLPSALLLRMPADQLEALLAHELAHVRRHDYLVNLLQSLVEALLFYHPVVWWLSRRIRSEREQIADDLAAQAVGDPRRLAVALAALAGTCPVPHPTLAPAAAGGSLMKRIQRLLRPRRQALDWKFLPPVLCLSVACVAALAQPSTEPPQGIVSAIADDDRDEDDANRVIIDGQRVRIGDREGARRYEAAIARDAARVAAEADRAGERARAEAERRGHLAELEAERLGELAALDAERAGELAQLDAIHAGARARYEGHQAAYALAMADAGGRGDAGAAHDDDEEDGIRTNGTLRIGGRAGGDGDYALVGGGRDDTMHVSASLDDIQDLATLRGRVGGEFLWLRRGGRAYVVTDPALVAQVRAAWATTAPVSREMEALGDEMEKHGEVMERIGARMEAAAEVGEDDSEAMEALGERMSELGDRQEALAERFEDGDDEASRAEVEREMEALSAQMEELGRQMEAHGDALERAHAPLEALGEEMERASQPMEALGDQMEVLGERMEELSEAADARTRAVIEQAARDGKLVPVDNVAAR